jgi:ArsR family transcriptional regulator
MSLPRLQEPPPVAEDAERAAHLAGLLRAVAHPLRLRIVAILCDGEEHVNALAARLEVPQAIVSQQLSVLRLNRLVTFKRSEGKAYYRLLEPKLRNLVKCLEGCRHN